MQRTLLSCIGRVAKDMISQDDITSPPNKINIVNEYLPLITKQLIGCISKSTILRE